MKIFNFFYKLILIVAIITIINGCGVYKTYTGHYFVNKCSPIFADYELNKKIESIFLIISNDFGFKKETRYHSDNEYFTFVKNKKLKGKYDYLNGSSSSITLIFMQRNSSITIRDYENIIETPFINKLKIEIENNLKSICINYPLFKRDSEFWN